MLYYVKGKYVLPDNLLKLSLLDTVSKEKNLEKKNQNEASWTTDALDALSS